MQKVIYVLAFCALMWGMASCTGNSPTKSSTTKTIDTTDVLYTCSMHPEVRRNAPGTCPKCGMDLEKVKK